MRQLFRLHLPGAYAVLLAEAAVLVTPVLCNAQNEAAVRQQILADWAAVTKKADSIEYRVKTEWLQSEFGNAWVLIGEDLGRYVCGGKGFLTESKSTTYNKKGINKSRPVRLRIANERYGAMLTSTRADQWVVEKLDFVDDAGSNERYCKKNLLPWVSCGPARLSTWMLDGSFVITRIEYVHEAPNQLTRVHFLYDKSRRNSEYTAGDTDVPDLVQSGYVDLDRSRSHRVVSYEFNIKLDNEAYVERGRKDYSQSDDVPILTRSTVESLDFSMPAASKFRYKEISTYMIAYNAEVAENEFYLTHYGLPEPSAPVRPTRWYLWFVGAGVACLALGGYLRYRYGRRQDETNRHADGDSSQTP